MAVPKFSTMLNRLLESGYEIGIVQNKEHVSLELFMRTDKTAERAWFYGDSVYEAIRKAYNSMYQKSK
jgi:phosphoglycolate phosphatase-like HAD superfamily hydrolase